MFVRAVSVRPNMEPEVKEETAGEEHNSRGESQSQGQKGCKHTVSRINISSYQAWWVVGWVGRHWCWKLLLIGI